MASKIMGDKVYRFSLLSRIVHWTHTATFLVLALTGLAIFTPAFEFILPLFGGSLGAKLVHRVSAVFFIAIPLIALIIAPGGFIDWVKRVTSWGRNDIGFLKIFPAEFFGGHPKIPPQGKFNAGEKINSLLQLTGCTILAISGIILWFRGYFPHILVQYSLPIHSLAFLFTFTAVMGHGYLALLHPGSKDSIHGMISGKVDRKFVESHYVQWMEELEQEDKYGSVKDSDSSKKNAKA